MPTGLFLLLGLLPPQEPPSAVLERLPPGVPRPVVDGVLDDAAWDHAGLLGELRQVEPIAGAAASQRTRVRMLHDDRGLFFAIECFDDDMPGLRATQMQRDANLDPDDRVEFLLDTFRDRRNAYWFQIGAGGSKGDALISKNGSSFNKDFDAIWYGRVRRTSEGWQAEIEIPSASLNFDPEATVWGFNLVRHLREENERARWSAPDPRFGFFEVAQAGNLTGIGPLRQGLGLDVVPFGTADWTRDRTLDDTDLELDAGVDVFYRPTPNSKLSVSLNTDFAETEVDQRRINLTRFPLFFPEKRDFFLEDSGAFFFGPSSGGPGGGGGDVIPFFSRRIGLDEEGSEVPILVASKLTGTGEGYSYGVLDVQTDDEGDLDGQNLAVARLSKNLFEQSDAGLIATAGDPLDAGRNATYGVDLNLRTDAFLGDRNLRFSSYVLQTDSDDTNGQDLAYHASVRYPNDELDLSAEYTVVERNFDPALGFVRREDMKMYSARFEYEPRLNGWIRQLRFMIRPEVITDAGNDTETVEVFVRPLGIEWDSGDEFRLNYEHQREVLDEDFEIQDGVIIPEDAYTFDRYGGSFETSQGREVAVEASAWLGTFFDGRRNDVELEVDWRPSRFGNFGLDLERNRVDLPGGDFTVHTGRVRANFVFTPEVSWSNFLQYDTVSDELGLNSRMRWILTPGREVNLVVNQGWDWNPPDFASLTTQAVVKVSYTVRL